MIPDIRHRRRIGSKKRFKMLEIQNSRAFAHFYNAQHHANSSNGPKVPKRDESIIIRTSILINHHLVLLKILKIEEDVEFLIFIAYEVIVFLPLRRFLCLSHKRRATKFDSTTQQQHHVVYDPQTPRGRRTVKEQQ
jgi:hypothetical protein